MISINDTMPDLPLIQATGGTGTNITTNSITQENLLLVAVPGAFTPSCSNEHLPGFIQLAPAFKEKGVNIIACLSVNDPFVMDAWAKHLQINNSIMMLSDPDASFTRSIGMEMDLSSAGLGTRSQRYSMLVQNKKVKMLNLDPDARLNISSAKNTLATMPDLAS